VIPEDYVFLNPLIFQCDLFLADKIERQPELLEIPLKNIERWIAMDRLGDVRPLLQWRELIERARALSLDDFALTGLATAVPLLGSAVLGLALQQGSISGTEAFEISRLDEAYQERQWGVDAEAELRTAARRAEADLLDRWFRALNASSPA
jgi:chaperone required for assembly of F1-ATPase